MSTTQKAYIPVGADDLADLLRALGDAHAITQRVRDALQDFDDAQSNAYRDAAHKLARDGHIEIDTNATVSKGDDAGAYVMAWLWVGDDHLTHQVTP